LQSQRHWTRIDSNRLCRLYLQFSITSAMDS